MKQFMVGLGVALVCGTAAAAEGFWVCKVDYPNEDMIVNLHDDRMVLFSEDRVFDSFCSNNVCISKIDYDEDVTEYGIFQVNYRDDKPFSILFTEVYVEDQKLDGITTEPKANQLFQCVNF